MADSIVPVALPITFSKVCEVVNQDLVGTNGRHLMGAGGQFAIATGIFDPTYVGTKDRLSNFRGYKHVFTASVYVTSIPDTTNMTNPTNVIGVENGTYMCYTIPKNSGTHYGLQLGSFSIPTGATIIATQLFTKVYASVGVAVSEEAHVIEDSLGTLIAQYGVLPGIDDRLTTTPTSFDSGYTTGAPAALTVERANAGLILYPEWFNRTDSPVDVCTDYYRYQLWWTVD